MKHIVEKWDGKLHESRLWDFYFRDFRVGVLDIETTGLNPEKNKFILGGIFDVSAGELHQILAGSRQEEPQAISAYLQLLEKTDVAVTYNGRKFDLPFIEKRRQRCAVSCEASACLYNLDLYRVLNRYSRLRQLLPDLKQKTVEGYMGLTDTRADEISGAESVELYNHYEATDDPEAEKKILLHNNDDVRQLTRLTRAITKSDFHKAMFHLGFPVKAGGLLLHVNNIRLERDGLSISGEQLKSSIDYMGFEFRERPVISRFIRGGTAGCRGLFEMKIPVIRQKGFTIADLQTLGISPEEFSVYPDCGSGFLVLAGPEGTRYRETNHFVKVFLKKFAEEAL